MFSPVFLATKGTPELTWFFEQMDAPGKVIVVILVFASFIGWSAMISKYMEVSALRKRNLGFELRLRNVAAVLSLESIKSAQPCPYEYLTYEATQAYKKHRGRIRTSEDIALCMGHVENSIQRGIARNVQKYEEKMILLSTLVSGGPFLGLLGTVWGVMLTFGGLASSTKAAISDLAPGVSGALMATTFGLLVAIPATFGYNYLLSHTKVMTTELENFASTLADRVELELQESARRARERRAREAEPAFADDGDDAAPEPDYDAPPRARAARVPATDRPAPVVDRGPTSADFGPEADDEPAYRARPPVPARPAPRLREARSWDEVE